MKQILLTRVCLTLLAVVAAFTVQAQVNQFCGSSAEREKLISEHPEILQREAELEQFTKNFEANYQPGTRSGPYIIPMVFHIIHQGGPENISNAQVLDEIRILNEDYNKRNPDTSVVISDFKSLIADVGIEFRLANIDPWGNCTNGIDRINSTQTYMGNDYSKMNGWPRDKYLNVWVVRSMENGVAGYAYYPGSVDVLYNLPNRDGVIILSNYIGSIGTGNTTNCRALTHEIGHYLNLKHPWGDTNNPGVACGDDDVNDTPITRGSTNCNLGLKYCHPPIIENVQNYMDYSYCSKMFTEGQKIRMIAALNSDKSDRNNLYSSANLTATGTDDTNYNPCAPKADFSATKRYICLGSSTTLVDATANGDVDTYYWEIPNGNPAVSTDKNPVVQFLVPGWQQIKLTVTNAQGSSAKENNALVYVANDHASYQAPFYQDFEDPNVFNIDEWTSVNYDNNQTYFRQVNYASHWGNGSAMLNNYESHNDHDIDEVVTPGFDLTTLSNADLQFSFYYSLSSWNQNFNALTDSLVVSATANCGGSWVPLYKKGGSAVVNAGYSEGFFVPTQGQAFWRQVKLTLQPSWKQSNVRFKIQVFSSVKGNNFYLDDVNIGNAVVSDVANVTGSLNEVTLYPNPAHKQAWMNISLNENTEVKISLRDMAGKEVKQVFNGQMNEGDSRIEINTAELAKGVYIADVQTAASSLRRKLVIE